MVGKVNLTKCDQAWIDKILEDNFKFHGAITNHDHWLTEAEADEKIYLYHGDSKHERQMYLCEEEKFIKFFKKLIKFNREFLCIDIGQVETPQNIQNLFSHRAFLKVIKQGLREKKSQRIAIVDPKVTFRILICYDLALVVHADFQIEGSFIAELAYSSGLYILDLQTETCDLNYIAKAGI